MDYTLMQIGLKLDRACMQGAANIQAGKVYFVSDDQAKATLTDEDAAYLMEKEIVTEGFIDYSRLIAAATNQSVEDAMQSVSALMAEEA